MKMYLLQLPRALIFPRSSLPPDHKTQDRMMKKSEALKKLLIFGLFGCLRCNFFASYATSSIPLFYYNVLIFWAFKFFLESSHLKSFVNLVVLLDGFIYLSTNIILKYNSNISNQGTWRQNKLLQYLWKLK